MSIENELIDFAESRNMILGICSAEPLTHLRPVLERQRTPFITKDTNARIDPSLFLEGAKSVIVAGLSYAKVMPERPDKTGVISQMAVGTDYHVTLKGILEEVIQIIRSHGDFRCRICVDDGPLVERAFAVKAGLGFIGKNRMVISRRLGSLFNIGCIVTDLPLRASVNAKEPCACGDCSLCCRACPGGALGEDGNNYDHRLCISYLTQKKGVLTDGEQSLLKGHIYGCDICQSVCPFNRDIPRAYAPSNALFPLLCDISEMTDDDFRQLYGMTAAGWRGAESLRRNARIYLESLSSNSRFKKR